jgi:hypothetical protein
MEPPDGATTTVDAPGEAGLGDVVACCWATDVGAAVGGRGPGLDESIHSQAAGAVAITSRSARASMRRMGRSPLSGGRRE